MQARGQPSDVLMHISQPGRANLSQAASHTCHGLRLQAIQVAQTILLQNCLRTFLLKLMPFQLDGPHLRAMTSQNKPS